MWLFFSQAELSTSLLKAEKKSAATKEADQLAGASAAQLASRQAQEQVRLSDWGIQGRSSFLMTCM